MTAIAARPLMPPWKLALAGFVAGSLATLIFHQGLWYAFNVAGLVAWDRPAWPLDPIPPFGVPSVISKAFWGGVWGAVLAPILCRLSDRTYWLSFVAVGAVALSLVGMFVVPALKGDPTPALWPRFLLALLLNGFWGFGTALLLRLADTARR